MKKSMQLNLKSVFLFKFIGVFVVLTNLTSCEEDAINLSENHDNVIEEKAPDRKEIICNEDSVKDYTGTWCCVSGIIEALPGETLTYSYDINRPDPVITWEVYSGDITLISGTNSRSATFKFGEKFTTGSVLAHGVAWVTEGVTDSVALECAELIEITSK